MDLDAGDSPWGGKQAITNNTSASYSTYLTRSTDVPSQSTGNHGTSRPETEDASAFLPELRSLAHATKLEAVDDTLDPLGPLGDKADETSPAAVEQAPVPPQKEAFAGRNVRPTSSASQTSSGAGMVDSVNLEEDGAGFRNPPPVQPPSDADSSKRQSEPSISIEKAAKPTFEITVGDPHKVGDLTTYRQPEFAVSRRYRDFLWLYNSMHNNNPGVVVPPPPEKQAVGRFDTNFVESRRAALERMLNKIAAHPILQHDGDLKIFLESETFNLDIKNKENREPDLGQSKGMFSSFGINVGGGSKFVEHDDNQLKALMKSIDTVVAQRKGLAEAAGDFSASLHALAAVELSPALSSPLVGLSDLQLRIKELYERQAQQDVLTLGITIDEYLRLIGSVKTAFSQRQKAFHSWHAAESEMQKRKHTQEKLLRQGKTQQDRLNQVNADVADAERKVHQARLLFEDMGRLMRNELQRFEKEKVEDFKSGVETFLESAVEAQKEVCKRNLNKQASLVTDNFVSQLIELWETFLLQLDAGEEGNPFYAPAADAPAESATEGTTTEAASSAAAEEEA
ncbi:unnamed protein product [Aspergillus oryzae]|uniref:Unnamed protein product n=1 Tax=Aspergillus oryzae TaxID=5062 RepID=A0AAN4Y6H5_ASPOZ|nr:unnamed protein product [Aspergillus oryzae]GMG11016.1 unnamed protein product [Aspergillus oryzae]GMG22649.1 unnamed protein product [Aspergillus oryzae]